MIHAAGILIISKTGRALFLQRSAEGDFTSSWSLPGGKVEDGEDSIQAAVRETMEEIGYKVDPKKLENWTRRVNAPNPENTVDFTIYILRDVPEFEPKLNGEHTAFTWAPLEAPPMPLHPGMDIALRRFTMNELDIAKAIRDGELTSPQWYENLALFAIRITGTGQAYRVGHDEVAVRNPEHYLTPEFLQHPKNTILDSEEYRERNIGSVFLPYIKGDEVWAVVKILDEPSALMMESEQLSTSPSVVWRGSDTQTMMLNGVKYLVEGDPRLLDHIAICRQGVWDKGGKPVGVETSSIRGDEVMDKTEFEKWQKEQADRLAAMQARNDEQIGSLAGTITVLSETLKGVAGTFEFLKKRADEEDEKKDTERKDKARKDAEGFEFSKRNDGEGDDDFKKRRDEDEKKCADAYMEAGESQEMAADKAKKRRDAEDEKEEKARDDARNDEQRRLDLSRGDEVGALKKTVEELRAMIPKQLTDDELNAFGATQSRADEVFSALGGRARAPMLGESLLAYRRHFVNELKKHSSKWKDVPLDGIAANDAAFTNIENEVIADALAAARSPASIKDGTLRMRSDSVGGHIFNTWEGRPSAWMNDMAGHVSQAATKFITPNDNRAH